MTKPTTNNFGIAVASDDESLTAGIQGPVLLHDHYLIEKLAQFNRERVPERIVHAKGGGGFGEFVVTGDVSAYTSAAVFQPGAATPTLQRFSSVAGEQGSPDTWRDVRGFSLRMYSEEGNFDIVGNNTPTFFLRDAIKFPDFIHSQKRLPGSGLRDADMQWDFWTLSPESAHQVTYLMGDRGLPRSWRTMPGYGSHTYQWINAAGERFWVKYHFHAVGGNEEMQGAEAELIAGSDADYYRRDLYEAIEAGNFPAWTVSVQVMPYEDAKSYRFNPFDLTKVWPHVDYPLIEVGVHTLNRNPENFFAEIEQAAFSPANTVPGIDISPDKMLMARVFSYPDAQRYRVGTNYNELPVNAPKSPVHNYQKDGAMRVQNATDPVYAAVGSWESDGALTRAAATLHAEDSDFGQAGTLYREVFSDAAKARFLETITGAVSGVQSPEIKERAIQYWTSVDADLGAALRLELTKGATTPNESAEYVGVPE